MCIGDLGVSRSSIFFFVQYNKAKQEDAANNPDSTLFHALTTTRVHIHTDAQMRGPLRRIVKFAPVRRGLAFLFSGRVFSPWLAKGFCLLSHLHHHQPFPLPPPKAPPILGAITLAALRRRRRRTRYHQRCSHYAHAALWPKVLLWAHRFALRTCVFLYVCVCVAKLARSGRERVPCVALARLWLALSGARCDLLTAEPAVCSSCYYYLLPLHPRGTWDPCAHRTCERMCEWK